MKFLMERMGGRVDRGAGIIRGVKLLGRKSRNGRTYTERAMREATPNYSGKKVFLDHPDRQHMGDDRKFRDWVGVIENAEFRGGCIYGDIRLRKQSEHYEALLEAAEEFSGFFGMSHVADGNSHIDSSGEEIVESIEEIFSVDIVTDPATTAGLHEAHAVDELGDLNVKVPGLRSFKMDPADAREIRDSANSAATGRETDGQTTGGFNPQPIRDLLAKHGEVIVKCAGRSAYEALASIARGVEEPAEDTEPAQTPAEELAESIRRAFRTRDFSTPGAFARRYR